MNGQSPWLALNTKGDPSGGPALSLDHFQSPQLYYDSGLFGVEAGYISPKQLNLDAALSSYPPLPELDAPFEDSVHAAKDPQISSPSTYLPSWPLAEAMPAWFDGEKLGIQSVWTAEAARTSTQATSTTTGTPYMVRGGLRDTSKDEYLVRCKEQGMSYKQIKESGGFNEAESTLRGRYRALTKPREARLRKPEWGQREIDLLFEGVAHCSKSNTGIPPLDTDSDAVTIGQFVNKVPWKQVAEYMESKGAYRYGNATVKKKYLEILKEGGASVRID
ncbi:hypothetical protein A1O3_09461 [Capronia epimyces CBS 606.96]|uniref:Myb-like domain-containing protein n=1 Tax=Capronia epimyces CBS 606.96 TaxID=1182542 RepID=W9XLU5_9EURO|nr:uncharacterized protein A1O3_09461 [Capronia epimyces CBS 606.96]EXJ78300.1 hypothetical protein A1O3_09461 [Capronia epimyces CBS 606.96]